MKNVLKVVILILFSFSTVSSQERIEYLQSFSTVYGYVKYFHPSTESTKIDWRKFSAYGSSRILACNNNEDLIKTMNSLFKPIAPSITFSTEYEEFDFDRITPDSMEDYVQSYWQHHGLSTDMQYEMFESVLVNQEKLVDDTLTIAEPIFNDRPKAGELIEKKIGDKLYCQIPLSLYSNKEYTYPSSNDIMELQALIDDYEVDLENVADRIGNVINVYNTMQHFYVYFDVVNVDWDKELNVALNRCFQDKNDKDHLITLQKFMATLRDSHAWVWQGPTPYEYYPAFTWEWVQDSLVITKVASDTLNIKVGDVVTHINGQSSEEYFHEVNSRISHGTKTYLNHSIKTRSLSVEENTRLTIRVNHQDIQLKHDSRRAVSGQSSMQENLYKLIGDEIMYVNLGSIKLDTLTKILPMLQQMKGLIFDYRGRNLEVWEFPRHFSKDSFPDGYVIKDPYIIYPDRKHITFDHEQGVNVPKEPYLGHIKTVFIIDGSVKSAGESFISTVKHNNLATIVGEQTAGANGFINPFKILGDITIWWTGTKVTNPDGSQFHCVGIMPDVMVEKSIQGIKEGRDEFIEKAIAVINEE